VPPAQDLDAKELVSLLERAKGDSRRDQDKAEQGDSSPSEEAPRQTADDPGASPDPASVEEFVFAPTGDGYFIRGFGEFGYLSRLKGLSVIAWLIQTPGEPVSMLELIGADRRTKEDQRSQQHALDTEAMRGIWDKLRQLKADLERARKENNTVDADLAQNQIQELQQALKQAQGLRGKERDLNNPFNKIRPRIHNQLRAVYAAMRKANPPMSRLADHFECSISSENGNAFIYRAGPPMISWKAAQK
jgi:hypothetical protein